MFWCVNGKYYWSISLGNIKRLRSVHVFVNYKSSDKPLKDLPPVRPYLADFTSHYLQTSRECFSLTRDFPMSRHFFLLWFLKQTDPRKLNENGWLVSWSVWCWRLCFVIHRNFDVQLRGNTSRWKCVIIHLTGRKLAMTSHWSLSSICCQQYFCVIWKHQAPPLVLCSWSNGNRKLQQF